ncbi:MAG: sigma-E factor negative regulatory protein [Ectothiorhodospira sp.]
MNATKEERLSALVDDEAHSFEVRRLVDELEKDPQTLARWSRYHLIGDLLRDPDGPLAPPDFTQRLTLAIEEQPVPRASWWVRQARLARPAAGVAMAGAVAVAVLLGVQTLSERPGRAPGGWPMAGSGDGPSSQPPMDGSGFWPAANSESGILPGVASPSDPEHANASPIERGDARMSSYLINHTESAMARNLSPYTPASGAGFPGE